MIELRGTGVALVTPFDEGGNIDFEGLKRLLEYTGRHVDYYVVMGTTGESATCTFEEKKKVLTIAKENNPSNLPIVYGIGGNNTAAIIAEIEKTNLEGVTAILSASPYYNKPSQAGIIAHYESIADASPLPIILYNVPGRTASNMLTETTLTLAEHPNIIAMKEASGDLDQCKAIADNKPEDFLLLSGEDMQSPEIIALGGVGAISVLANGFPETYSLSINQALEGNTEESRATMDQMAEINPLMYEESNPVGIKAVLKHKGVCGDLVRLPLLPATNDLNSRILELL